jgi:propanol-preferring alcohol dehydrogenase
VRAVVFEGVGRPLRVTELARPEPGPGELLVRVGACGVCRTDLHIRDGELDEPRLPLVLGHQIVGRVDALGPGVSGVSGVAVGDRVGVPWLGSTCGDCGYCESGRENLCDDARFTGYHRDGGFAEWAVVDGRYCFPVESDDTDAEVAPLLCAGLIGYRSLRSAGDGHRLGLYGFGASAHIVLQLALHEGREVYAFTRAGD